MAVDPLTERLKDQVSASIQDALEKATSVLSNLHRVKSYMEVLANLPVSRAGEVIKCAVEQVQGMKADTTTLLQTVYLTEIGLGSLQELDKGVGVVALPDNGTEGGLAQDEDDMMPLLDSSATVEEPLAIKKLKLGVSIQSCVSCSRKFAHQSSTDQLCRVCRGEPLQSPVGVLETSSISNKSTPRLKKRKVSSVAQKCSLCGTGFVYRRCLLRHIKENHPNTDSSNLEQYIQPPSSKQGGGGSMTVGGSPAQPLLSANSGTEVQILSSRDSIVEQVLDDYSTSTLHVTIDSESHDMSTVSHDMSTVSHDMSTVSHDMSTVSHDISTASLDSTNDGGTQEGEQDTKEIMDGKCLLITMNGEKIYKCTQCSKVFSRPYRIQRHLQVHNPVRHKVQCHVCGKYFTRVDTLQTHIRCVHTDERPFACTFEGCDKCFPVQSGLVYHLKSHMDGKPYKCPECSASFALMTEFKGHMMSEHEETKDLRCSDCFKVFPSVEELERHRSLEHRLECEICNKTFAKLGFLQAHVEIHSGPSLYNCRFCNSGFDNEYSYKQHIKSHPKYNRVRKMHPCPVCGDSFMDANDLMLHYQTEEHREKVKSLGVGSSVLAAAIAIGQESMEEPSATDDIVGSSVLAAAIEQEPTEELSATDEAIMRSISRSISESDAFQAALAAGVE